MLLFQLYRLHPSVETVLPLANHNLFFFYLANEHLSFLSVIHSCHGPFLLLLLPSPLSSSCITKPHCPLLSILLLSLPLILSSSSFALSFLVVTPSATHNYFPFNPPILLPSLHHPSHPLLAHPSSVPRLFALPPVNHKRPSHLLAASRVNEDKQTPISSCSADHSLHASARQHFPTSIFPTLVQQFSNYHGA